MSRSVVKLSLAAAALVLALGTSVLPAGPAGATPVLATGAYDSDAVTLLFTGNRSGVDATKVVVYPAITVRTPPVYPVASTGVTDGCSVDATSPNPGVSFAGVTYNALANITTVVVTVQNTMGAGAWAVQVGIGAVSADDPGCTRFVIPEQL